MKICRFDDHRLGVVEDDVIYDVSAALKVLPSATYPFPAHDILLEHLDSVRDAIAKVDRGPGIRVSDATLLSPVANPGKLVGAPVNYQAHMDEAVADPETFTRAQVLKVREIGLFLKATSSLIGSGQSIEIAHPDRRTDHEVELAAIIGKTCRNVTEREALSSVAAFSIGLDVTVRGPEERSLRKSLDTYSVLGPWMVTADEFGDPAGHELALTIDGRPRQKANTSALIMDTAALIVFASAFYTLHPGDVIYTGTPDGVGPINPGERIKARISGIGSMTVDVRGARHERNP